MNPEPVILIGLVILIIWAYFIHGRDEHEGGGSAADPEASRRKAQAIKEAAIQEVIDAHLRGEIDVKTRNAQIAHLSRLPTNPQDGPGGDRR